MTKPTNDQPKLIDINVEKQASTLPPKSTGIWRPASWEITLPSPAELSVANLFELVPASEFTIEELTHAYNQTNAHTHALHPEFPHTHTNTHTHTKA